MFSQSDTIHILQSVDIIETRELSETGTSVKKIDKIILKQKDLSTLSELLSENTNVFIKTYGRGSLSTASFRGTTASHTKVLWNNVSLSSPMLGMVDMSLVPMSVADEVNIYCGSASMRKSETAIGGLVEISTNPIWKKSVFAKISSSVASFHTYDNTAEIRCGTKRFHSVTKFYLNSSKNDFKFYNSDIAESMVQVRENADYKQKGLMQELYFRTSGNSFLSAKFWFQNYNRGVPGLTTNESGLQNNKNRQDGQSAISSFAYKYYTEKSKLEISLGNNLQSQNYLSQSYVGGVGYYKVIDSHSNTNSIYTTANYSHSFSEKIEISALLKYNFHKVISLDNVLTNGYDKTRTDYGALVSLFCEPFSNLKCGISLRQDFYDKNVCPFSSSIYIEYEFERAWYLKSSLAKNYSVPTLNDLFYVPGGNPNLLPETGYIADIGLEKILRTIDNKLYISAELGANCGYIRNWIMWLPTNRGYWTPENIEKVIAYGGDFSINGNYLFSSKGKISVSANFAYTHSSNESTIRNENDKSIGKQLAYIPLYSANLFSKLSYHGFYFFYQWNYFSKRFTTSAEETGTLVSIYPYFMNDIGLGKSFLIKNNLDIDLNFKIYNLFNESYRSVLWQPMPRINFAFQLSVSWK